MEISLFLVVVLLVLGVAGLTVGVSNDAVNFLNSSIGSKVAPLKFILVIAAFGILAGVTFSSGMMEVARKGIFNPQYFTLWELLVIFFAAMLQHVILLDLFNTYGMPTSTTVSIVFGLFGGAVAVSLLKIASLGSDISLVVQYINTAKVFAIFTAILLSVAIAFVAGYLTQYLTRLIFTFEYKERLKRYGAIWGAFAVSAIAYFILIKGAKGASFISEATVSWIYGHTWQFISIIFAASYLLLQISVWLKLNILKFITLFGTFALAMAFAANDLVNFIGAPLAGLNAYQLAIHTPNPDTATMEALAKPFKTNTWILLFAGAIMSAALIFSKKSRTVSKTEINLGRQDEGFERFESSYASRIIVRFALNFVNALKKITPNFIIEAVNRRFDTSKYKPEIVENEEPPAFDLVRASVNLSVAAALISYGTSLKLPLSTTYVTFIVAMATALADKAWGRESAVYRVSGTLAVIGGWFFTAFMAAATAGIIALIVFYANIYGVAVLIAVAAYIIYRSYFAHKERQEEARELEKSFENEELTSEELLLRIRERSAKFLAEMPQILEKSYKALFEGNLKELKKARKQAKKNQKKVGALIADILRAIKDKDDLKEGGYLYAKAIGALHESASRLAYLTKINFDHLDNNYQPLLKEQIEEMKAALDSFKRALNLYAVSLEKGFFEEREKFDEEKLNYVELTNAFSSNELERNKRGKSTKNASMLLLSNMDDTTGIIYNAEKVVLAYKKFAEKAEAADG